MDERRKEHNVSAHTLDDGSAAFDKCSQTGEIQVRTVFAAQLAPYDMLNQSAYRVFRLMQ